MTQPVAVTPPQRVAWLDRARGVALVAMIIYHAAFDLAMLGLTDWQTWRGGWKIFAVCIAGSFIFLSGVSLRLSWSGGMRWGPFLRRSAILVGAAALVTLGTWIAMPRPITFGILHAIAVFSFLAIPFLRLPVVITALFALAVLCLPFVWSHEVFSHPLLYPFGLDPTPPPTFDYEPIFPWFAAMLLGFAVTPRLPVRRHGPATDIMARMGRNSLVIYLIHQPILLGVLMAGLQMGLL